MRMANKGYRERCSPASAQAGIWNKWKTAIAGKDVGGKLGFLSKLNAQLPDDLAVLLPGRHLPIRTQTGTQKSMLTHG